MIGRDPEVIGRLLEEALALPQADRERFLDHACGSDGLLRHELTSLVAAHPDALRFFDDLASAAIRPALHALGGGPPEDIQPGRTVSHYRIIEKVGAGGMGVVFRAHDEKLGRFLALKFLPPHLIADPGARERFLTEARSASALDHPNIAVVHGIDTTDTGRLFIVMPYYEGETLELRCARGPLPPAEALEIARQIASALAAAHSRGIVHRDVKPANVLITSDGTVRLLDFGIAKLGQSTLTGKGHLLGTLAYMSPEQLTASEVDHRADLWSVGVLLYEMLAGVRPFRADHDDALIYSIRHDSYEDPARRNGAITPAVLRILDRCLSKNRDERYRSAEELAADLAAAADGAARPAGGDLVRYAMVAALAALLLAAGWGWISRGEGQLPQNVQTAPAAAHRLAVMPLSITGAGPEEAYLAEVITAELVRQISTVGALRVAAPSAATPHNAPGATPAQIGRALGVTAVLHGSMHRAAEEIRLTLHLMDSRSEARLWSGSFAASSSELQSTTGEVARRVATVLHARIEPAESRRLATAGTSSPEAYMLYLKGRHFLEKGTPEAAAQAREYFQQALDHDPAFARAWSGYGDSYHALAIRSPFPAADAYPRMKAAAERALQLDPEAAEAHVSLGTALSFYYWDFGAAAHHYRRAIELNPSNADTRLFYAEYLRYHGRFDEALAEAREAEALDPLSPKHRLEQGITLYLARRYDEAADQYHRLLNAHPDFVLAHFKLALVHVQKRQYDEALAALDRLGPEPRWHATTLRSYIYGLTGRADEARQGLEALEDLSLLPRGGAWHFAIVYAGLGEHERAIDLLEEAFRERAWEVRLLPVEPLFDPLRGNPRFTALVKKLG
jgi:eukaryotic-like serine/threonine-protein kinase